MASRYYTPPVIPSSENPIADAIGNVGRSIGRGLMLRRQREMQQEQDAIEQAQAAERLVQGGWQEGVAPDLVGHRQIEALPELPQSPFLEPPPEDPVGEALRSFGPRPPEMPNPAMMMPTFGPNPDYMETQAAGKTFHRQTPAAQKKAEDKEKEQADLKKRQRELATKATELGVATPDWSATDVDEFEMTLANARRRDALSRRGTSVGFRAAMPDEDLNAFQSAVEAAESRNAQSIQSNRVADDARMARNEEVDARIGRLASAVMHIKDPAAASRAVSRMLTSKDHRLGISAIDVIQRARISGSSRGEQDPKAEARKVWEKIAAPIRIGSSGATRNPSAAKITADWEKMKPELTVLHGEDFVAEMDALIRQLAAARGNPPQR